MKIGFTVDTNIIKDAGNRITSIKKNTKLYLDYIKALSRLDKQNSLIFYLIDIVKKEILTENKNNMEQDYNELIDKYKKTEYLLNSGMPENKIEELMKEEEDYCKRLKVLKLETSTEKFERVINLALDKKPPFKKENGDAGFKDCLIWETMLDSKEIDECNIFYFFTCDDDYKDERLEKEFKQKHPNISFKLIMLKPNGEQRQQVLQTIIEKNDLKRTDIISLYNEKTVIEYIHNLNNDEIDIENENRKYEKVKIKTKELTEEDIVIENIIEKGGQFEIYLNINTTKYEGESSLPIQGKIIITLKKNKDKFDYIKHEYQVMKYYKSNYSEYINHLNRFNNSISTLVSTITKNLKQQLEIPYLDTAIKELNKQFILYNKPLEELKKMCEFQQPLIELSNKLNNIELKELSNINKCSNTLKMPINDESLSIKTVFKKNNNL